MISPIVDEIGSEDRRFDVAGEPHLPELFGDELPGAVDVRSQFELYEHQRQPRGRVRADTKDAGRPVKDRLERHGHQRLDFLGSQAGSFGKNSDGGSGEVRKDIDRCPGRHDATVDQQQARRDQDQQPIFQ